MTDSDYRSVEFDVAGQTKPYHFFDYGSLPVTFITRIVGQALIDDHMDAFLCEAGVHLSVIVDTSEPNGPPKSNEVYANVSLVSEATQLAAHANMAGGYDVLDDYLEPICAHLEEAAGILRKAIDTSRARAHDIS